jgi:hypothetical protein
MSTLSTPSAEASFEALVARCRRRAGVVLAIRYSVVAFAVTLGTVSVIRLLQPERVSQAALDGAAIALGALCVAIAAVRRYPTPREVAAAIDRHCNLDDAVVAALQVRHTGTTSAVAPLIVTQAVQRTADLHARDVFPMDLRRPALMLAAGMVLVVAALPSGSDEVSRGVAGGSFPASGGSTVAAAAETQGTHAANTGAGPAVPAGNVARSESGAAGAEPHEPRAQIPGAQGQPTSSASAGSTTQPAPAGGAGTAPQSRDISAEGARGGTGAGEIGRGRSGTGAGSPDTRADSTGNGGGGAGKGTARGTGSGGVHGGDLLPVARQSTTSATAASNEQPARYGEAQRNAEAALTRGDIPPELRSYVREYFRAITR